MVKINPKINISLCQSKSVTHSVVMWRHLKTSSLKHIVFVSGVCPLLCSGHGVYGGGQCHCVDGWKGPECDVRETECILPDCSGHGHCQEGVCICKPGWTGEHCQISKYKLDCYAPVQKYAILQNTLAYKNNLNVKLIFGCFLRKTKNKAYVTDKRQI